VTTDVYVYTITFDGINISLITCTFWSSLTTVSVMCGIMPRKSCVLEKIVSLKSFKEQVVTLQSMQLVKLLSKKLIKNISGTGN